MTATGNDGVGWNGGRAALSHAVEVDVVALAPNHIGAIGIGGKCRSEAGLVNASVHPFGVSRIGFELPTKGR